MVKKWVGISVPVMAVILLVLLSGVGNSQDGIRATPGTIPNQTVADMGYELTESREIVKNRTRRMSGLVVKVSVYSYVNVYTRQLTLTSPGHHPLASVTVVTTPSVRSLKGDELNPVAGFTHKRLLQLATDNIEKEYTAVSITNIQRTDRTHQQILNNTVTNYRFTATASYKGTQIRMLFHVARLRHNGDFVILVGNYPAQLADSERARVETMFEHVNHPVE